MDQQDKNKRIEQSTKIRLDADLDLVYDSEKKMNNYFDQYKDEVQQIKPLYHPQDIACELRNDEVKDSLSNQNATSNAAVSENGYFISIKTI